MPLPSEVFKVRLREARRLKGWTQQELAAALSRAGVELGEFAITRLENGKRGVSLDQAIAIAAVLGVSPLHMIVPLDDDGIQLTPQRTVTAADARAWLRGLTPLQEADEQLFYAQTPESEADWLPTVPGAWRSQDPKAFQSARARWEREIFRAAMFPGSRDQWGPDAEDVSATRPGRKQDHD